MKAHVGEPLDTAPQWRPAAVPVRPRAGVMEVSLGGETWHAALEFADDRKGAAVVLLSHEACSPNGASRFR
jgi:hypothetical protein